MALSRGGLLADAPARVALVPPPPDDHPRLPVGPMAARPTPKEEPMNRQLTVTAAAWASVRNEGDPATFSTTGGRMVRTLWLVGDGWPEGYESIVGPVPPVEFVQACAPCETCGNARRRTVRDLRGVETFGVPCPDCRIELVGPCPWCDGSGISWNDTGVVEYPMEPLGCPDCEGTGTVTLGHAYAVGEPLPILHVNQSGHPSVYVLDGGTYIDRGDWDTAEPVDLAHYGPPESLVQPGRQMYAIKLEVVSW